MSFLASTTSACGPWRSRSAPGADSSSYRRTILRSECRDRHRRESDRGRDPAGQRVHGGLRVDIRLQRRVRSKRSGCREAPRAPSWRSSSARRTPRSVPWWRSRPAPWSTPGAATRRGRAARGRSAVSPSPSRGRPTTAIPPEGLRCGSAPAMRPRSRIRRRSRADTRRWPSRTSGSGAGPATWRRHRRVPAEGTGASAPVPPPPQQSK